MEETSRNRIQELDRGDLISMPMDDVIKCLPLELIKSEIIPPPPNIGPNVVDWLPEFAGCAWVAYGASSCLIVSHFPSPASATEVQLGPIFRQVFQLSSPVVAVSWSPITPSLSALAAASGKTIYLFEHGSTSSHGSIGWRQTRGLVQGSNVDSVMWTGSGDGMVASGREIVIWKRESGSWRVAWKFEPEIPHALVSTSFSIRGPLATAPFFRNSEAQESFQHKRNTANCVLVYHKNESFGYLKSHLRHPQPISFIQWRQSIGRQSRSDARAFSGDILLTCCLDGTVRLWSEIDTGKPRKQEKGTGKQQASVQSLFVIGMIEINQVLNGTLGTDISVIWATETNCSKNPIYESSSLQCCSKNLAMREWLIGFGPGSLLTFWEVHFADDVFLRRFPQMTLWKKQQLQNRACVSRKMHNPFHTEQYLLNKVVISREHSSGPPDSCSLIQVSTHGVFEWSFVYTQTPSNSQGVFLGRSKSEDMSCTSSEVFKLHGHFRPICYIKMRPLTVDIFVAASLDTDGVVLVWTLSSNLCPDLSTALCSTCSFVGKLPNDNINCRFSSLGWGPLVSGEVILLLGHMKGIDFILLKLNEQNPFCKLYTTPFPNNAPIKDGPHDIHCQPLSDDSIDNTMSFLLLGIWFNDFYVFSWKITLHSCKSSVICTHHIHTDTIECGWKTFMSNISEKRYGIKVELCSMGFSDPHLVADVTSYALVCPSSLIIPDQEIISDNETVSTDMMYHVAIGCANGSLTLWRSCLSNFSSDPTCLQLVGVLSVQKEPILSISLSSYGQKVAIVCSSGAGFLLYIWEIFPTGGSASFLLEDSISLDGNVVALNWLTLGNGRLLLGVCLQNEVQIYGNKRTDGDNSSCFIKSSQLHVWFCFAVFRTVIPLRNFSWGPNSSILAIRNNYFCIVCPFVFFSGGKHSIDSYLGPFKDNWDTSHGQSEVTVLERTDVDQYMKSSTNTLTGMSLTKSPDASLQYHILRENSLLERALQTKLHLYSMEEVEDKLCGSLPIYHPKALLINIYLGNLGRAQVGIRHLMEGLVCNYCSSSGSSSGISSDAPAIESSQCSEGLSSVENGSFFKSFMPPSFSFVHAGPFSREETYKREASCHVISSSLLKPMINGVSLLEKLKDSFGITNVDKMQLLSIADIIDELLSQNYSSTYASLDEPGRRFWVGIMLQQLLLRRRFGKPASPEDLIIGSELIAWAVLSDFPEILCTLVLSDESSWQDMRKFGVGFWLSNPGQLRTRMEKLARNQYLRSKDPKACALLYVALSKVQVLAGLFKISKDEKDKLLAGFLSRNFQEDKNREAAMKNAYVLMSKHQYELAIAFFLLGGDTLSAVTVCAKNFADEQFAFVICRLVEGQNSKLTVYLASKILLPAATERGDYWLVSLLQWVLGNPLLSYTCLFSLRTSPSTDESAMLSCDGSFFSPTIGHYCFVLASTGRMKNAVGEKSTFLLRNLANLMLTISLKQIGLVVDAMERMSSCDNIFPGEDHGNMSLIGESTVLGRLMETFSKTSSHWLAEDSASALVSHIKLDLAKQFFYKLLSEDIGQSASHLVTCPGERTFYPDHKFVEGKFISYIEKIFGRIEYFEQKNSICSGRLVSEVTQSVCNIRSHLRGYNAIQKSTSPDQEPNRMCSLTGSLLQTIKLVPKAVEDICVLLSRFIVFCNLCYYFPQSDGCRSDLSSKGNGYTPQLLYVQGIIRSMEGFRRNLVVAYGPFSFDLKNFFVALFHVMEYCVYVSINWIHGRMENLIAMIEPLLMMNDTDDNGFGGSDMSSLGELLIRIVMLVTNSSSSVSDDIRKNAEFCVNQCDNNGIHSVENHMQRIIMGICLWTRISLFFEKILTLIVNDSGDNDCCGEITIILTERLKMILTHVRSYWVSQLVSLLYKKMESNDYVAIVTWLVKPSDPEKRLLLNSGQGPGIFNLSAKNTGSSFEKLWLSCVSPKIVSDALSEENILNIKFIRQRLWSWWVYVYEDLKKQDKMEIRTEENKPTKLDPFRLSGGLFQSGLTFLGSGIEKLNIGKESFHPAQEIYQFSGELLQALCVNRADPEQVSLASNRKGVVFIDLGGGEIFKHYEEEEGEEEERENESIENIRSSTVMPLSSHPSLPFFLSGSKNDRVYLWKFGRRRAVSAYSAQRPNARSWSLNFDGSGCRFASAESDGTVSTWQLEERGTGGLTTPTASSRCFDTLSSDVAYVARSGSVLAASGHSADGACVVVWDTLVPSSSGSSGSSIVCHERGARSLALLDPVAGGGGSGAPPLMVSGGRGGSLALHDLRSSSRFLSFTAKAHIGSVTRVRAVPDTALFMTGGEDGDVKLWDSKSMEPVRVWPGLHDRRLFLQPLSHSYGGVVRARPPAPLSSLSSPPCFLSDFRPR